TSENAVTGSGCKREKREFVDVKPYERRDLQRDRMKRIKRREALFAPTKARYHFLKIPVNVVKHRHHLMVFREDERIDDLVKMFLIEVFDRVSLCYRCVQTVGTGNVVIERNADENVLARRGF